MSLDEVRERSGRYRLENAYLGDVLVGCSTVRPPEGEERVATVIARVLPAFRGPGITAALYERGLGHARVQGAGVIERERYVLDGERGEGDERVDLRLVPADR
ncbi:hypothetical protein ACLGIH_18810 [Streptomyces sp. HMX87]|uniref:hypothetical protein n=1 Tax=Streptomyces sp. HMX87 TaxID=3390849 RepID=UPI003A8ACC58